MQLTDKQLKNFWNKVKKTDSCWLWTARKFDNGYGQFQVGNLPVQAHRVSYIMHNGNIPSGLVVHHECRVKWCVNPAHLRLVTHRENLLLDPTEASRNAAKTHCDNGHEFTPENTRIAKPYQRVCKTCQRQWQREYRERKRSGNK